MTFKNFPRQLNLLFIFLIPIFFYNCSNSDNEITPNGPVEGGVPFEVSVFAKNNENIFQVDILGDPDDFQVTNLSESEEMLHYYQEVFIDGPKVTFFHLKNGGYAFWQKDVLTGMIMSRSPICDLVEGESLRYRKTNGNQIALITEEYQGIIDRDNYLRVYDSATDDCNRFYINNSNLNSPSNTHLHNNRLYVYTLAEDGSGYSLTIFNSNTGEQVYRFTFANEFRTMMNEEQLIILFSNGTYKSFRLNDFSPLNEGSTGTPFLYKNEKIYNANFKGNIMAFEYPYSQPAPVANAPAIYNWDTNEITHGGDFYLARAKNELINENQQNLNYTVVRVDLESNILIAGYRIYADTEKGGVFYFNFDGELLMDIPLDYIPFEILIRE